MSQMILFEATPNPQAMKFVVTDRLIAKETAQFLNATESLRSPLARKLFGFPWAAGVTIAPNFVTVVKKEWVDWQVLAEPLSQLIEEHIASGEPVLLAPVENTDQTSDTHKDDANTILSSDSDIVKKIKTILIEEIRPAVAMDGGDIQFYKFADGIVYVQMLGSCSGCPSSTMTLKEGIEVRLRQAIPEILEVQSI